MFGWVRCREGRLDVRFGVLGLWQMCRTQDRRVGGIRGTRRSIEEGGGMMSSRVQMHDFETRRSSDWATAQIQQ